LETNQFPQLSTWNGTIPRHVFDPSEFHLEFGEAKQASFYGPAV
jgi:hypothetical protein